MKLQFKGVNPEGLSWAEWSAAARSETMLASRAWRAGEDPTEWAASAPGPVVSEAVLAIEALEALAAAVRAAAKLGWFFVPSGELGDVLAMPGCSPTVMNAMVDGFPWWDDDGIELSIAALRRLVVPS